MALSFLTRLRLLYVRHRRAITLGVRSAVLDGEGRVLLVRHSYTPGWHFPGGGVDPGETASAAAARELAEETGIVATRAELFGLYLNRVHAGRDHVALFVARAWRQAHDPGIPNLEIRECRFFSREELPDGTTPGTRRRIAEILEGADRSPDW
jgi:8-oxo-dGTP pyrophosphatase MutT (NUDIX family)